MSWTASRPRRCPGPGLRREGRMNAHHPGAGCRAPRRRVERGTKMRGEQAGSRPMPSASSMDAATRWREVTSSMASRSEQLAPMWTTRSGPAMSSTRRSPAAHRSASISVWPGHGYPASRRAFLAQAEDDGRASPSCGGIGRAPRGPPSWRRVRPPPNWPSSTGPAGRSGAAPAARASSMDAGQRQARRRARPVEVRRVADRRELREPADPGSRRRGGRARGDTARVARRDQHAWPAGH